MELKLSEHFTYKKLILYVLPCVAMMILTSVYSIVDGFFVSNYAGKNAFAAVNLIMPVLMGVSSLGFMIGTGGSALVAFYLGLKNPKKANEVFSMLIELILLGASIIAFFWLYLYAADRFSAWCKRSDPGRCNPVWADSSSF